MSFLLDCLLLSYFLFLVFRIVLFGWSTLSRFYFWMLCFNSVRCVNGRETGYVCVYISIDMIFEKERQCYGLISCFCISWWKCIYINESNSYFAAKHSHSISLHMNDKVVMTEPTSFNNKKNIKQSIKIRMKDSTCL